jgi:hypothetical protein
MDARARALELVDQWHRELRELLPAGADIFDAHLHLGHDIDGMIGDYDQLIGLMDAYGISGAFMFCLDEPDRHPSFSAANDRTLAHAAQSKGRLIPFVRAATARLGSFAAVTDGCRSGSSRQNMKAREIA